MFQAEWSRKISPFAKFCMTEISGCVALVLLLLLLLTLKA
jgi:hypothetical protein